MKIICLLLCTLSLIAARVHPRTGVNDDLNGVDGVIIDTPEYEDPEVTLFKLITRGVMPVYTVLDAVKDSKDLSNKNDTPHYQTDDITKGLDTVIIQLQEAKNKLESGNNAIYFDIDKSVLSLENLKQRLYLDLHNASTERPVMNNVSTELLPVKDASTEQPHVMKFPHTLAPEFRIGEEVKTGTAIDDVSSEGADKVISSEGADKVISSEEADKPFVMKFPYTLAPEFGTGKKVKTDTAIDDVSSEEDDKPDGANAKDEKYPDTKPMKFPFHRRRTARSREDLLTDNMKITDVAIKFLA